MSSKSPGASDVNGSNDTTNDKSPINESTIKTVIGAHGVTEKSANSTLFVDSVVHSTDLSHGVIHLLVVNISKGRVKRSDAKLANRGPIDGLLLV